MWNLGFTTDTDCIFLIEAKKGMVCGGKGELLLRGMVAIVELTEWGGGIAATAEGMVVAVTDSKFS